MSDRVRLDVDGAIATITNDNPDKHNAFDDEMDVQLFAILGELKARPDIRAVIWRGEGRSWSSGRDVGAIGQGDAALSHHELMSRGHAGIQQVFDLPAPVIVAIQGWAIGGSFQRALLCDVRIAAEGARFMLPEVGHGVIPDTGCVGPSRSPSAWSGALSELSPLSPHATTPSSSGPAATSASARRHDFACGLMGSPPGRNKS